MHSLEYYLARTKGVRRILKFFNKKKIGKFQDQESRRKSSDPQNIMNFESQVYSQNGEDGIIGEIFKRIGSTNKFFVEFGFENGSECNCRNLLESDGWSGVWIDGNAEHVKQAKKAFGQWPVKILQRFITKENIQNLFAEAEVPQEFDLLSIDLDGNDYWIWNELKDYSPRVVVVEYNASHLPDKEWVMPYNPQHSFDGTNHYGASLLSFENLGKDIGYTLVGCESNGINAFFVRSDLVEDKFSHSDAGSNYHYVSPKYRDLFFGHPRGKGPWGKHKKVA